MRIAILALGLLLASCSVIRIQPGNFDGERALELVDAQLAMGARHPGSPGHEQVGDWIEQELMAAGWAVEEQAFYEQNLNLRNWIGRMGNDSAPLVILGAHYDTRELADRDAGNPDQPVPGANDGASGVAVLLELGRVLPQRQLNCQVWLVFFDAEDGGGLGSRNWIIGSSYFASHLEKEPQSVVVVDMVGDADLQLYFEQTSGVELRAEIWEVAASLGMDGFIAEPKYSMLDDHTPFLQRGIPAVDIIDFDYPYWHTTEDTFDKVSSDSLQQVGEALQVWLELTCE